MKLAIMQPYFLPYIGYFQLIAAVDTFIVYDNIKYTKKGWINRNRWLQNGSDATFTLPLEKASDFLDINQRKIAGDFDRRKFLNQLKGNYAKAPHFESTFVLVEKLLPQPDRNLFDLLLHSLVSVCQHLNILTKIQVSSTIAADHSLKGQDRVLDLCRAMQADTYINAIGGTALYSERDFANAGMDLRFIRSAPIEYPQFDAPFVPWLSIVDVLMFNPVSRVQEFLVQRDLVHGETHA
jgi:hypothetical protein